MDLFEYPEDPEEKLPDDLLVVETVHRCPCTRLAGVLNGACSVLDFQTVHLPTVKSSCARWVLEYADAYDLSRGFDGKSPFSVMPIPLGDGRFTIPLPMSSLHGLEWPIPLLESDLGVWQVIRQWVEEPPFPTLGERLKELSAWKTAVEWTQRVLQFESNRGRDVHPERISKILAKCGLPGTPGTAAYLLRQVDPHGQEPVSGPTRGVRIVSVCLAPVAPDWFSFGSIFASRHVEDEEDDDEGRWGTEHGEIVSQIITSATWSTPELRAEADRRLKEHQKWWRRVSPSPVPPEQVRERPRKDDELKRIIDRFRPSGNPEKDEAKRAEIYARAVQLRREKNQAEGKPWNPDEVEKARKTAWARMQREGKLE